MKVKLVYTVDLDKVQEKTLAEWSDRFDEYTFASWDEVCVYIATSYNSSGDFYFYVDEGKWEVEP